MNRLLPDDVVNAYRRTGLIPIRLAWTTTDARGGCAIDTLAHARGCTVESIRGSLDKDYETGFLAAWDADNPHDPAMVEELKSKTEATKQGYCDAILCRRAVEKTFSSGLIPVHEDASDES